MLFKFDLIDGHHEYIEGTRTCYCNSNFKFIFFKIPLWIFYRVKIQNVMNFLTPFFRKRKEQQKTTWERKKKVNRDLSAGIS
jgi:hypothetical protein